LSAPWDILAPKFERLVESGSCPPPGEMLLAVAAEFRPVDATAVSFRLDECARTLFDAAAARDGGTASHRLAALLTDELRCRTDGAGACRAAQLRGRLPVGRHD
jgi:hypothetical protein